MIIFLTFCSGYDNDSGIWACAYFHLIIIRAFFLSVKDLEQCLGLGKDEEEDGEFEF